MLVCVMHDGTYSAKASILASSAQGSPSSSLVFTSSRRRKVSSMRPWSASRLSATAWEINRQAFWDAIMRECTFLTSKRTFRAATGVLNGVPARNFSAFCRTSSMPCQATRSLSFVADRPGPASFVGWGIDVVWLD